MGATTVFERGVEARLTAFGVTKTIAEWEMDSRAAVYASLIQSRLGEGMSPEQAISTPVAALERGPTKYMAWGERKTLRDWADDYRAETSYANIRRRIEDGWNVEEAIATATQVRKTVMVTAFGETKSLTAWAEDERAGASRETIANRLAEGMAPEEAITLETPDVRAGLTAFGETKTLQAWAEDERCSVSAESIGVRLRAGVSPEEAITRPAGQQARMVEAFGERKNITQWSQDARCAVGLMTLWHRITTGMEAEAAILTPPTRPTQMIEAWGETKSRLAWSKDPRAVVGYGSIGYRLEKGWSAEDAISTPAEAGPGAIVAWGETKSAAEWSRDARCSVTEGAILGRLESGLTPEEAISNPGRETNRPVTAFGETKTTGEWAADPRCAVRKAQILARLANGWEAERAITLPVATRDAITAWGETKAAFAWTRDERCAVGHHVLTSRMDEGWDAEEALTTPAKGFDRTPITAFGETKSGAEWARDPRATNGAIRERMARGMTAEEAIAGPVMEQNRDGLKAFGEWKSFKGWSADARCSVGPGTIIQRIERGMAPEEAITTASRQPGRPEEDALRLPGMAAHVRPIVAWGETKSQSGWARDERCPGSVTMSRIRERLDEGWDAEAAIATPYVATEARTLAAFGEEKTFREWSEDPRAVVGPEIIRNRVKVGWDAERSITTANDKARHEITAFGETKLVAAWGRDPRAKATDGTILRRIEAGWPPEEAIATPAVVNRPIEVTAFGETKNLAAWARDERAAVSGSCVADRIARGWDPEEAITTPRDNGPKAVTAFGETKTSLEWAEDPRCLVERPTLMSRLARDWNAERAMTEPVRELPEPGVTAFGETKSMARWAADPRCRVSEHCLAQRLGKGESPEEAIVRPSRSAAIVAERRGQAVPEGMEGKPVHTLFIEAFGETKCLAEWARDPRCVVAGTTLKARLRSGMAAEAAITTVPERGVPLSLEAFGETRSAAEWARDARCRVSLSVLYNRLTAGMALEEAMTTPSPELHSHGLHEAFGETKTLKAWSEDPRCAVTYSGLKSRVLDEGMAMEAALTAKAGVARRGKFGEPVEALGETKTLGEWMKDGRCVVARPTLLERLRKGWSLEEALTAPAGTVHRAPETGRLVEAFGEHKTLARWIEDSRCAASLEALRNRLDQGETAEKAMARPSAQRFRTEGFEAFGESKTLREWAEDARCVVPYANLRQRVSEQGVEPELAMTVPLGRKMRFRPAKRKPAPKPPKGVVTAFGETKSRRAWAADPRCTVTAEHLSVRLKEGMMPEEAITTPNRFAARLAQAASEEVPEGYAGRRGTARLFTAFGETKSITAWAKDARCVVAANTLKRRLDLGMAAEEAISTENLQGVRKGEPPRIEAFGESKTMDDWMEDARVTVTRDNVLQRMRAGWTVEEALGTPKDGKPVKGKEGRLIEAFGERKNINAWARDPRCPVKASSISMRLKEGWSEQRAVETPVLRMGDPRRRKTECESGRELTAWGVTKRASAWAKDPRCAVSLAAVARRLSYGWTAERALSEPQHAECLVMALRAA